VVQWVLAPAAIPFRPEPPPKPEAAPDILVGLASKQGPRRGSAWAPRPPPRTPCTAEVKSAHRFVTMDSGQLVRQAPLMTRTARRELPCTGKIERGGERAESTAMDDQGGAGAAA
jgi:hypothetical protein